MRSLWHLLPITGLAFNAAWTPHADASVVTRNDSNLLPSKNPLTSDFAAFVKDNMDFWHIPGMAIAVIDNHDVFAKGYGLSALSGKNVTPETLFYAGSTTKAQTAACLSALIQNGSYEALAEGWSTKISSILKDDFVLQDQWATDHLTLDDAVSHRTGLPRHDRALMREKDGQLLSTADIVRNMRNLPFVNEPRVAVHYSNYMYITLSHVIETVTKKDLKQVMKELIWNPLGMNSTYFGLEDAKKSQQDLATGYLWVNETGKHNETTYMPATDLSGAAAVISNVRDYAKWIQALVNNTQAFSDDTLYDIRAPRMLESPRPGKGNDVSLYGLGWYRSVSNGHVFYRHDGSMIGFKAQVYWFPNDKFGFVIFANADEAATANAVISWKLIADKFNIPVEELVNIPAGRSGGLGPEKLFENAANKHFPNHTQADPSFSMQDMEGTYSDAGYGTLTLRSDQSKPDVKVLIAERPDMTWDYGLTFRHVVGDSWIAGEAWLSNIADAGQFHPVEFVKGDDGKPAALKMRVFLGNEFEGNVTFTKK